MKKQSFNEKVKEIMIKYNYSSQDTMDVFKEFDAMDYSYSDAGEQYDLHIATEEIDCCSYGCKRHKNTILKEDQ